MIDLGILLSLDLICVRLSFIALALQQRRCDAGLDQVPGGSAGADRGSGDDHSTHADELSLQLFTTAHHRRGTLRFLTLLLLHTFIHIRTACIKVTRQDVMHFYLAVIIK